MHLSCSSHRIVSSFGHRALFGSDRLLSQNVSYDKRFKAIVSQTDKRSITSRARRPLEQQHLIMSAAQQPVLSSNAAAAARQAAPGHPTAIGTFPSFSTVNFYAGSQLSRLSWLRQSADFLNEALTNDKTRFILLQRLNPLVHATSGSPEEGTLATLSWDEVKETIGQSLGGQRKAYEKDGKVHLFGPIAQGLSESVDEADKVTQGMGPNSLALVFLGMDEGHLEQSSLPGKMVEQKQSASPAGIPYFALSLSFRPPGTKKDAKMPVERLAEQLLESQKYDFVDTRALAHAGTWPLHDAAMVAQARSLIDWNERHQFCPACSRRQYSLWAGWKRACASALGARYGESAFTKTISIDGRPFEEDGKGECPTTKSLSNFCYPRTDPTVIMAIVSPDNERILLGRQKTWPKGFYSCLAGFLEPGESLEEAVRREIYEESGVGVGHVVYHSSQPWPFPANLMMGAIGQAEEGKDSIRLDLDNELEDARFFSREEVLRVVESSSKFTFTRGQLAKLEEQKTTTKDEQKPSRWDSKDTGSVSNLADRLSSVDPAQARPSFKIPGQTAIAHVLISAWARGEAHFPSATAKAASDSHGTRGRM